MDSLERYLEATNPWWRTSTIEESSGKLKRDVMDGILPELDSNRMIQILGPRRAGKTTTMYMIMDHLLRKNVNASNILYVSIDDPMVASLCDHPIMDPIEHFMKRISSGGRKYIFLDEVQDIKEWYKWLKGYHDRKLDVQFIVSGSSSLQIEDDANKYLRGRIIPFIQYPLDFRGFLKLCDIDPPDPHFLDDDVKLMKDFEIVKEEIERFMLVGGFPEWFQIVGTERDVERWFNRLYEDVPKKAFYEDIVKKFGIRNPRALEILFAFIAQNQSRVLSYESMNRVTGLDRMTVQDYIGFLKSTYLLIEIGLFAEKVSTTEKANKKYLLLDQGIRNGLLKDYMIKEENSGFIRENIIGIFLHRFCESNGLHLNYIRSNGEIDFIISFGERRIPVEVKSSDKTVVSKEFLKFMKGEGSPYGIVITDRRAGILEVEGMDIRMVPLWIFLTGNLGKNLWD
jgi:hypothetical protein